MASSATQKSKKGTKNKTTQDAKKPRTPELKWFLASSLCALVAVTFRTLQGDVVENTVTKSVGEEWRSRPLPGAFNKLNDVQILEWDNTVDAKHQFADIIAANEPVVIRNSPVAQHWKALELWKDNEYLAKRIEKLGNVRYKAESRFTNEARLAYSKLAMEAGLVDGPSEASMDLFPDEFLNHDTSAKGNGFHYYYASTLSTDMKQLTPDVSPFDFFNISRINKARIGKGSEEGEMDLGIKSFTPYVWMTHGNNSAAAHFDVAFNFNVQVVGHKRFILQPISAWPSLHINPNYHLSRRQSRIDLLHPVDTETYPLFNPDGEAYQVVLSPGEVLYVPPYLFHSVETLDFCVNVNFFSDFSDLEQQLSSLTRPDFVKKALSDGLTPGAVAPFVASMITDFVWTSRTMLETERNQLCSLSVEENVRSLQNREGKKQQVAEFLDTSIRSRFAPAFERIGCSKWEASKCPKLDFEWGGGAAVLEEEYQELRHQVLADVKRQFCSGLLPEGALDLWLLDWVEQVIARNLGVSMVCSFLRCLQATLAS